MKIVRARYGRVEAVAEGLLEKFRVKGPRVPIEEIVSSSGVEIRSGRLGDVSGMLIRKPGENIIGVNSAHAPTRQRFTIAHEFGHFVLHEGITAHYDKDYRLNYRDAESAQATNVEEVEANFFAASILMPRRFLEAQNALNYLDSDEGVANLAKKFEVSPHAMSLRLSNVYRRYRPF